MNNKIDLSELLDQTRALDDASILNETSDQFLELVRSIDGSEIRINGNAQGLVHFARRVLEVAAKDFDGAHEHFDELSGFDHCDVPLIVRKKQN